MDNPFRVGGLQGRACLLDDVEALFVIELFLLLDLCAQLNAFEKLHHKISDPAVFRHAEIRNDDCVRVAYVRGGAGFAAEALERRSVAGKVRVKDLDRDGVIHVDVDRAVDFPHPPFADLLFYSVLLVER